MSHAQPWILGLSTSHNGSVALVHGSELVVSIQEERLTRQKRHRTYAALPMLSARYCLEAAGIEPKDLDMIVVCPQTSAAGALDDVGLNPYFQVHRNKIHTEIVPHHLGHAYAAYALSGFQDAAILVIDGMGSPAADLGEQERSAILKPVRNGWETISLYRAEGKEVIAVEKHVVEEGLWLSIGTDRMKSFGSLGGMFSSAAAQIFGNVLEAGKVMGLAPYGKATFPTDDFFRIENGSFVFSDAVPKRFLHADRWPAREREYNDLSASVQAALEAALMHLIKRLFDLSPSRNFCYAGGVALNSVANERVVREFGMKQPFLMPAAEDSGPAIGAAYFGLWSLTGRQESRRQVADHCGRTYTKPEVAQAIERAPGVRIRPCEDVLDEAVDLLVKGKIVGWFEGGSELGPRALGHRSILCDPRLPDGKAILNQRVKHREAFRPFAPAVLKEYAHEWFDAYGDEVDSPFMLRVCHFRQGKGQLVPAVMHVDNTGRVQTITKETNGRFYELVRRFHARTGVPIVLNTSFNVMGEPIVETPEDALWCLAYTGLDHCVFQDAIVSKNESFKSILDFVPKLQFKRYAVHDLVHGGRAESRSPHSFAVFTVPTPWGDSKQVVGGALLGLVEAVDGVTSGWGLLHRLKDTSTAPRGPAFVECVEGWEMATFAEAAGGMRDYTTNMNTLVDDVAYPRLIAATIAEDARPIRTETELCRALARLRRARLLSFLDR